MGREMCGHVIQVGSGVSKVGVGDQVVGMGFGAFGPEMITHAELVAPAPEGFSGRYTPDAPCRNQHPSGRAGA